MKNYRYESLDGNILGTQISSIQGSSASKFHKVVRSQGEDSLIL